MNKKIRKEKDRGKKEENRELKIVETIQQVENKGGAK